jgi:hypothetical protein
MSKNTASSLKARLEQLERDLAAQARGTNTAATLSAVVGGLVLLLLTGYFVYGYTQFEAITQPEPLINAVATKIRDSLPDARKSLEEEITKAAPAWAENLSKQAVSSLPTAREKLRDYTLERMEASVTEANLLTEEEFRAFLRKNRAELDRKFEELSKDAKLADASLAELETLVETQLKTNMTAQSRELLTAINSLVAKLKKLATGAELASTEKDERHLLMVARRIQEQYVGDPATATPAVSESSGVVGSSAKRAPAKLITKGGDEKKDGTAAKAQENEPAKAEPKAVIKAQEKEPKKD